MNVCTYVSMNLSWTMEFDGIFHADLSTEDGKKSLAMSCCEGKTQLRNYGNFAFMTQIFASLPALPTCRALSIAKHYPHYTVKDKKEGKSRKNI